MSQSRRLWAKAVWLTWLNGKAGAKVTASSSSTRMRQHAKTLMPTQTWAMVKRKPGSLQVALTFWHADWIGWDVPEQNPWESKVQEPEKHAQESLWVVEMAEGDERLWLEYCQWNAKWRGWGPTVGDRCCWDRTRVGQCDQEMRSKKVVISGDFHTSLLPLLCLLWHRCDGAICYFWGNSHGLVLHGWWGCECKLKSGEPSRQLLWELSRANGEPRWAAVPLAYLETPLSCSCCSLSLYPVLFCSLS